VRVRVRVRVRLCICRSVGLTVYHPKWPSFHDQGRSSFMLHE